MSSVFTFFPGQKATIFLETLDSDGYRTDSPTTPVVTRVFGFNIADGYTLLDGYFGTDGYQQPMTKFSTGLYYVKFTLPKGATALGNYLVDVSYVDPITLFSLKKIYQVFINAPFGNFGAGISL
jgi:hypothetical protein